MEDVDPENQGRNPDDGPDHPFPEEGEDMAARATVPVRATDRITCCPHAALALAMASTAGATWGSSSHSLPSSEGSTTEPPEEEDWTIDECSSEWSDFGEYPVGPDQVPGPEDVPPAPPTPAEPQPTVNEGVLAEEEAEPVSIRPRRRRRRRRKSRRRQQAGENMCKAGPSEVTPS